MNDKLKIISEVDRGSKEKAIAEKFGIPASSLSTISKNRDIISKIFEEGKPSAAKRMKICVYEDIDSAVSGVIIKEKALKFAESFPV